MKSSPAPSVLGLRYLPFLVALAVFAGVVLLAPSRPPSSSAAGGFDLGSATSSGATGGVSGTGGSLGTGGVTGSTGSGGTTGGLAASGGTTGGVAGPAGAQLPGGGSTGSGGSATGGTQVAGGAKVLSCPGSQPAPYYTGIPCVKGFTGSNGGATMRGVTGNAIRITVWAPQNNPATAAVLSQAGFGQTPTQFCEAQQAFYNSVVKRFQTFGRKLVAVDGPGNNAGSKVSNSCHFPYFASQCSTSPLDIPCIRAEADTIASQGVSFVIAQDAYEPFYQQLARRGVFSLGDTPVLAMSRKVHNQIAPYWWGAIGTTYERVLEVNAEYYCKRLVGRPPQYAGSDVSAAATKRHTGLIYYSYPGADTTTGPANAYINSVHRCGDSKAKSFSYTPDVSQSQSQATNLVAQARADGVTTLACFCDVITELFILKAMDQNNYHPEIQSMGTGTGAADSNGQVGYAAAPEQLRHVFGLSNFAVNTPDSADDYHKAYADGGGSASESALDAVRWPHWRLLGQLIQQAGPQLNPSTIFRGGQAIPARQASPIQVGMKFGDPDYFTPQRDFAEVWFDPNLTSAYNGSKGAYCYVNHARRYDIGQLPSGEPNMFSKSGPCATTRG